MSQNLIIWLPDDPAGPWAWLSDEVQGWAEDAQQQLELSGLAPEKVTVICPGTWVRMFADELPDMKMADRLAAAGFSIEDKLAAPLSEQHLVLGGSEILGESADSGAHTDLDAQDEKLNAKRSSSGDKRIAVIARGKMKFIEDSLAAAGLMPQKVYAEYDVLPKGAPVLFGEREIYPGPMGHALDVSQSEMRDGDAPEAASDPFSLMAQMDFDGAVNLAQGVYARRVSYMIEPRSLMRLAAMLAICAGTWLLWQGAQGWALKQQAAAYKIQAAALYTETTGEPAPDNPARAVTLARRQGQAGSANFLQLSAALFSGLAEVDGVVIDSLRFDDSRNELVLRLVYSGFEDASQLESVFESRAGQFRSGAVRDQSGRLIGDAVFVLGTG